MRVMPAATETPIEEFLPVLTAGRHRGPRRGACFMEYASYLACERWSDHPSCTHPTLAALARLVNDLSSDSARSRLVMLIPSVVGLTGDDPRVPVVVSALAAAHALPIASESRQRALAGALLRCDQLLGQWHGPAVERVRARIRTAFDLAPGAEGWARAFADGIALGAPRPVCVGDEAILRTAVLGIADACVTDTDARLERLLASAIGVCGSLLASVESVIGHERVVVLV
jgi:hypothetical protein